MGLAKQWLHREGIVKRGMWEPIHFIRMKGGQPDNYRAVYDFLRSRAGLEMIAEAGFNQVWFNWWKGYGLQFEKAEQDKVIELIPYAHELGLRVICYCTFGTIVPETMLVECPECRDWLQVNEDGKGTSCQVTHQAFRFRPCLNSEGWLSYMEKVVARAIEAGADGIHFDNIGINAEPDSCKCPRCVEGFRRWLWERYGPDSPETRAAGIERFGHNYMHLVTLPWFNRWNQPINMHRAAVPVHQEWTLYKCHVLTSALGRMADFIRSLKPDAMVEANAGGNAGVAQAFWSAVDVHNLFPKLDLLYNEGMPKPHVNERGATVVAVREMKEARAFDLSVEQPGPRVHSALQFAFTRASFTGGREPYLGDQALHRWYHRYKTLQLSARPAGRVAVLHHRESRMFNRWEPFIHAIAMEQYLIERRIPWQIIHWVSELDRARFDLVILPAVECLSDEEARAIVDFVRAGGSVLATGDVGRYDLWRRERMAVRQVRTKDDFLKASRRRCALAEIFGDVPQDGFASEFGAGRAAYLAEPVWDPVPRTPDVWMIDPKFWQMPKNADDIDNLMKFLVPDGFGLEVHTGFRLVAELCRLDDGRLVLHLINVEDIPASCTVRLRLDSAPRGLSAVSFDRPDADPLPMEFNFADGLLTAAVGCIRTHEVLVVDF